MSKDWFPIWKPLYKIRLEDCDLNEIQPDAFNHESFENVTSFETEYIPLTILRYGTFHGMSALEYIFIKDHRITKIEPNLLVHCPKIIHFSLMETRLTSLMLSIDNLTGTAQTRLQQLIFNENNFGNTIGRNTFFGLLAIVFLSLENCEITSIGEGAFDYLPNTLRELDLSDNHLMNLPENIFSFLETGLTPKIDLSLNQFHCDCRLNTLRQTIADYIHVFQNLDHTACETPKPYEGYRIAEIQNLCNPIYSNLYPYYADKMQLKSYRFPKNQIRQL